MSKEIEIRAKEYANFKTGYSPDTRWAEAIRDYTRGAEDQMKANVENCVKWCEQFNRDAEVAGCEQRIDIDSFRMWITKMLEK